MTFWSGSNVVQETVVATRIDQDKDKKDSLFTHMIPTHSRESTMTDLSKGMRQSTECSVYYSFHLSIDFTARCTSCDKCSGSMSARRPPTVDRTNRLQQPPTHPSTNRARCRASSLFETNALTTRPYIKPHFTRDST